MNKNTQQSAKCYDQSIEKHQTEALYKVLEEFYTTVCKRDWEHFERPVPCIMLLLLTYT